jgi:hypothetical protein
MNKHFIFESSVVLRSRCRVFLGGSIEVTQSKVHPVGQIGDLLRLRKGVNAFFARRLRPVLASIRLLAMGFLLRACH